ncbi:hypothetical protein ON010_g28 [Phytophthora cinnamomi]|nr:hypothetical protein ON010_g28 [Phytophthora cinnamomi]
MYAIQPGSGVCSAGLNATEMLILLQRVGASCRQAHSISPARDPGALIPVFASADALVSPTDLRVRMVQRQHIVDCELQLNRKRKRDLLSTADTVPAAGQADETSQVQSPSGRSDTMPPDRSSRRVDAEEINVDFLSSDSRRRHHGGAAPERTSDTASTATASL